MTVFLVMVSLGCAFGGAATQQPTDKPTHATKSANQPTGTAKPTSKRTLVAKPTNKKTPAAKTTNQRTPTAKTTNQRTPTLVANATEATEAPTAEAEQYFTETFDSNLDHYTYFNNGKGDEDKMSLETDNSYLAFNLKDNNLWIYVTYNPFMYKDVAIELTANNRGKTTNAISLLCRYSKDTGWYEFSVANDGSYWIYAYDATGAVKKGYTTIAKGTSKDIKQGKESNIYNASCVGNKLTLTINNVEVKTIKDMKFNFREGKVGFSVSSFDITPILVDVDSFTISEP
jgi:hypothetical protein